MTSKGGWPVDFTFRLLRCCARYPYVGKEVSRYPWLAAWGGGRGGVSYTSISTLYDLPTER